MLGGSKSGRSPRVYRQSGLRRLKESCLNTPRASVWASLPSERSVLVRLIFLLVGQLREHVVDQAKFLRLVGGKITVALGRLGDFVDRLTGVERQDLVEALTILEDLVGLNFDVGNLPADLAPGLVDHDLRVRQGEALALGAGGQNDGRAAGRQTH